MTISEALDICKNALKPYEGGEEVFIYISEIINEYFEKASEVEDKWVKKLIVQRHGIS